MYTRPRIIPVLLIEDGDLVKTKQFKSSTYLGDPINAVKIFNLKGIDEMAILDISATRRNKEPDFELLEDIASQAFMPLCYGGGIKTVEQVRRLLAIGYEKVVINTEFIRNPKLVEETIRLFGSQCVVISIDAIIKNGQYQCLTAGGSVMVENSPVEMAKMAEKLGAGEILLNSVDRDGMMEGYDISLIRSVVDATSIPVTACGGAGGVKDIKKVLKEGNAHAAAGGSMFVFYGRLKAVLITAPCEKELFDAGIYEE